MAPCLLDERIINSFKHVNTYPSVRKYHRRIGEYRGKGAGLIVDLTEDENISRYHRPPVGQDSSHFVTRSHLERAGADMITIQRSLRYVFPKQMSHENTDELE